MKTVFKKVIVAILMLEARLVILRFKPKIIAVTGSVGKTSTKDAIYTALADTFRIRKNQKSMNSEIGTPLTILGLQNAWADPMLWIKNIALGFLVIFKNKYPDWLVLEIGVDRPGDIARVAKWLKPDVVVITALPDVPAHVEYFDSPEAVVEEKLSLIKYMKSEGALILNTDDPLVLAAAEKNKDKKVITYGMNDNATISFSNTGVVYSPQSSGFSFKLNYQADFIPITIQNVLGIQHAYPVVAAIAVGISQDIPFLTLTSGLKNHEAPRGRMNLVQGKNNSTIVDDTYNALPISMKLAVEALDSLQVEGKKIAVLGDMLEIGKFSADEHKKVGAQVAKSSIDILVAVGLRSEFIATEALKEGMDKEKVFHVKTSEEAISIAEKFISAGSVMLVKGSQGIRTEKVVAALMADPSKRKELLVRQEVAWENR